MAVTQDIEKVGVEVNHGGGSQFEPLTPCLAYRGHPIRRFPGVDLKMLLQRVERFQRRQFGRPWIDDLNRLPDFTN
jgi:hypothetical protein